MAHAAFLFVSVSWSDILQTTTIPTQASKDVNGLTSNDCTSSSIGRIAVLLVGSCFANDLHHLGWLLFSVVHLGEYRELLTGCLWMASSGSPCCCRWGAAAIVVIAERCHEGRGRLAKHLDLLLLRIKLVLRFLSWLWVGLDGLKQTVSVIVVAVTIAAALGKEVPGRELRLQLT